MFPIKTDKPMKKQPLFTIGIIIICCIIHWKRAELFPVPGLVPIDIIHSILHWDRALPSKLLTVFAAFFIHGSLMHLAGNMWYLWIFGSSLEQHIHRGTLSVFYMLFGVVSMLVQVATDPLSPIPIVGASGAIAGIMGMYLVLRPLSFTIFWLPPIFFIPLPSALFLAGWFWLQWHNAHTGGTVQSNVAWWAHIGGFFAGACMGVYVRISGGFLPKRSGRKTAHSKK